MKNHYKAGVVQFDVKKGQIENNLKNVFAHLEQLASDNISIAVLPEMFTCSFDNTNLKEHAKFTDMIVERLSLFAKEHQMAIAGTLPEIEIEKKSDNCLVYNTMIFIDGDGQVKAKYRKLHLFRLTGEHLYYSSGKKIVMVDTSLGKIGFMTCYDLRFPEHARKLYLQGAKIIVVSAQWPEPRINQWSALIKARAIENQLFMICSNRTGTQGSLQFPGMSMIVDPLGNILADAGKESGSAFADIDMKLLDKFRKLIPCDTDRRHDIYG
jgi:omega-amidase